MVTVNGYAKINLLLDILGQREDGYHEIATVMQSLALADTLTLTKQETGITLTVDLPELEADERNLAYRAAALLMRECGVRGGVHIRIDKRIPVAAGLAGGSADAAAALRGVNELYALGQSDTELCRLGAQIGSDVPFSLMEGRRLPRDAARCSSICPLHSICRSSSQNRLWRSQPRGRTGPMMRIHRRSIRIVRHSCVRSVQEIRRRACVWQQTCSSP